MQFVSADKKTLAQATIDHDADHVQRRAAVSFSSSAGETRTAIHVRLYAAAVTGFHAGNAIANSQHFDTQLMSGNPWIPKERKLPQISAEICATDTHPMSPHKNLPNTGRSRIHNIDVLKVFGLFETDCFHRDLL